jgi:hypothetical protein
MATSGGPSIRDVIAKQYEANETYHEHKAQSAWIASSVYFAFSLGLLSRLIGPPLPAGLRIPATVLCVVVFSGAMSFVSLQFSSRWDSVVRTGTYHEVFGKWSTVRSEADYQSQKDAFEEEHGKQLRLGLAKKRRAIDILLLTVLSPVVLLLDLLYRIALGIPSERYRQEHADRSGEAEALTKEAVDGMRRRDRRPFHPSEAQSCAPRTPRRSSGLSPLLRRSS